MAQRSGGPPKPGRPITLPIQKLADDLSLDLWAFCEAHYGAPMNRIVREALKMFIHDRLEREPETKKRFEEAKRGAKQPGNLSVIGSSKPLETKTQ